MPGILDDIKTENVRARITCPIGVALATLEGADRDGLVAALADATITSAAIARVLTKRGYATAKDGKGVASHRSGRCSCA